MRAKLSWCPFVRMNDNFSFNFVTAGSFFAKKTKHQVAFCSCRVFCSKTVWLAGCFFNHPHPWNLMIFLWNLRFVPCYLKRIMRFLLSRIQSSSVMWSLKIVYLWKTLVNVNNYVQKDLTTTKNYKEKKKQSKMITLTHTISWVLFFPIWFLSEPQLVFSNLQLYHQGLTRIKDSQQTALHMVMVILDGLHNTHKIM